MSKLIFYFFLVSFCFAQAQETIKEYPKHSLGINFNGNYSYRTLKWNKNYNPDLFSQGLIKFRNESEKGGFGFNLGLNYLIKVHKNIGIELSTQIARKSDVFNGVLVLDLNSNEYVGDATIKHHNYYFDIPLKLNYIFLNKDKFHLFLSSGIDLSIYLKTVTNSKINYYNGEMKKHRGTDKLLGNHMLFSYIGSFGFDYDITPTFTFRVEPIANVSFFTTQSRPIIQHPYSFGLNTGVYYNF